MTASRPIPLRLAETPMLSTHLVDSHVAAVVAGRAPRRVVIVGPAGSGKSRLLRRMRDELDAAGATVTTGRPLSGLAAVPVEHVLVIDDVHLLDVEQLDALAERAADPEAAIVVTARPWPRGGALGRLTDALERSQPAIVLGSVGRDDLRTYLDGLGETASDACLDALIDSTGGATWLASEALSAHEMAQCRDDDDHDVVHVALRDVIAHRLRTVAPDVRDLVELVCLDAVDGSAVHGDDAVALSAYAEGLLLPNGRPAPVVRAAVRATCSIDRVIRLCDRAVGSSSPDAAENALVLVDGVRDPQLADLLLRHGDAALFSDPHRARILYRRAGEAGAEPAAVAIREARAEWELGDVESASRLLDGVGIAAEHPDHAVAADIAAGIWAARGLPSMSDAVYRASATTTSASHARATVAAFAVADRELLAPEGELVPGGVIPSTLDVALGLLDRGLRGSLTTTPHAGLGDLLRSAETYSAARTSEPISELPAVVAALAALHTGEPQTALSVLDNAIGAGHGGRWAHDRLVLWRAWAALQLERAHEVETALGEIAPRAHSLGPRDRLLFDAVSVSVARRYHDVVALSTAWRGARESLMRASFDLFGLLPLGEFVVTAARLGEPERVEAHFAHALERLARLGSPPLWSPHMHWAGIQQAILRGRPADMKPHAAALVGAASHSAPASIMAQAGRVWTSVLAGAVDADAVEAAAVSLGTVGLAWDGARLAGHGAGRTNDRRISARLLAIARRLHPHEDVRAPAVEGDAASAPRSRAATDLSPRELEVAALVVQGKTYTEIGATIFISPRTAEHHIARIRRRLGATNRSDLIAKLRVALDDADDRGAEDDGRRASA